MSIVEKAREYCREKIKEHPDLKHSITEFYYLFLDEIQDEAASENHEYELLVSSIKDVIEESKSKTS